MLGEVWYGMDGDGEFSMRGKGMVSVGRFGRGWYGSKVIVGRFVSDGREW